MIVRGESTIIDYHAPFDQGLKLAKAASEWFGPSDPLRWFGRLQPENHSTVLPVIVIRTSGVQSRMLSSIKWLCY